MSHNHFISNVAPEELDRRGAEHLYLLVTGGSFAASVVILSLGVLFVNISKVVEYVLVSGALYVTMGLLFLISGSILALALVTKRRLFINIWFGVIFVLIVFHFVDLGYKVRALVKNGEKEQPSLPVAIFYSILFALTFSLILGQVACVGLVARYRSLLPLILPAPQKTDVVALTDKN